MQVFQDFQEYKENPESKALKVTGEILFIIN
jgi:hypothetical protein